jgi:hypothetical protein
MSKKSMSDNPANQESDSYGAVQSFIHSTNLYGTPNRRHKFFNPMSGRIFLNGTH